MRERIYLDTCVLNRPTDDQDQPRIRIETAAIASLLDLVAAGAVDWIASTTLRAELNRNPDLRRRQDTLRFLSMASELILPTTKTLARAQQLHLQGHGEFDALHLAIAEEAGVTSLLSVDDRFIALAARGPAISLTIVENPVDWCRRRQPWLIKR